MNIETAIENLKEFIYKAYESTINKLAPNIYRGHLRSLSTDIEDGIALFVSSILPDCKVIVDSTINVNKEKNRPDILIADKNNETIAMIEIKSNMGWCRNAKNVIDDIVLNDKKFQELGTLYCELSRQETQEVTYGPNVKLFLIALTDSNCSSKNHAINKAYAATTKVHQFNLFSGWYAELYDCEITDFANELLNRY